MYAIGPYVKVRTHFCLGPVKKKILPTPLYWSIVAQRGVIKIALLWTVNPAFYNLIGYFKHFDIDEHAKFILIF